MPAPAKMAACYKDRVANRKEIRTEWKSPYHHRLRGGWAASFSVTAMDALAVAISLLLRLYAFCYDALTLPVYILLQKPWRVWAEQRKIRSRHLDPSSPYSPIVRVPDDGEEYAPSHTLRTYWEMWEHAVKQYGDRPLLGRRPVLEETLNKNGARQLMLGNYEWASYREADLKLAAIRRGLLEIDCRADQPISILSETRPEWLLTALACFKIKVPVATLYATLGTEGLIHGLNETEVEHIFTSSDLLPKLRSIVPKVPKVRWIVYYEDTNKIADTSGFPSNVKIISYSQLQRLGDASKKEVQDHPVSGPDDLVVIMYTSGTTGTPKAIALTHNHLTSVIYIFEKQLNFAYENSAYAAYLPLAHIFELGVETLCVWTGIPIGYCSPLTLTRQSPGLMPGCKGDLDLLKPMFISQVPLTLDRIYKAIISQVNSRGPLQQAIFHTAVEYKLRWWRKGFETPLLDLLIFQKVRQLLGGQVRVMLAGSAPLSRDTEEFVSIIMGVDILQGYGMTETVGAGTCAIKGTRKCGQVGPPIYGAHIKLEDWAEGGYRVTDVPNPRGEILVGTSFAPTSYYKKPELGKEVFVNIDGMNYCRTGDIGEYLPDGTFKIIDRKKDLVKLIFGEYVSLGKVESELKTSPLVDNILAYGNGHSKNLVALVSPNKDQLGRVAKTLGKDHLTFEDQCEDDEIVKACSESLKDHAKKCRLFGAEIPAKFKICCEAWTRERGMVTAAFKVRRKVLEQYYKEDIEKMYKSLL